MISIFIIFFTNLFTFLICFVAFIIGYIIYEAVEAKHAQLARKNPADFENEV